MPTISIPQLNLFLQAKAGENLMSFLQSQNIPVASSCLGDGICSMCKVKTSGVLAKPTALEKNTLVRNKASTDERLSCQISIQSDLEISTKYW